MLVTRPRAQSQEMVALLEGLGARVICCPMIEIVEPDSWDEVDAAIAQLTSYDYLIFTSANGVKFFFERLRQPAKRHRPKAKLSELTQAVICVIGSATGRALEGFGEQADLIAADAKAEGLLQAIIERVGDPQAIRNRRFLIPRAKVAREILPDELRRLGAQVEVVEVYQTVSARANRKALMALLANGEIDAVTFTSPSTVQHFVALVGTDKLSELMQNVYAACIGSITARTAADYGLPNLLQSEVSSAAALVEALATVYKK